MIRFPCPQCDGVLEAFEYDSSKETNCHHCGHRVQIPPLQDDFFRFSCPSCGKKLKANPKDTGKNTHCVKCGTTFAVPTEVPSARAVLPTPVRVSRPLDDSKNRVPLTLESLSVGHFLIVVFVVWAVLILLTVLTATISKWQGAVLALLTCLITTLFAVGALDLMRAKMRAMKKRKVAYAWLGLLGVVAWDPNEGVLFLKDKKLAFVHSDCFDGGGIKLLLPWLGEEVVCRVPLEVRTTKFIDKNVLTREYVPLTIKGAIYWRLANLQSFYLSVSQGIHEVDERGGHSFSHIYDAADVLDAHSRRTAQQLESAEEWLRLIAEEQTRAEVMQAGTGLLIADKIVEGLPVEMQSLLATDSYHKATDGLAEGIRRRIEDIGGQYGIQVERVSLQEVEFAPAIRDQAINACVSAYTPLIAQRHATAKKLDKDAEAYGRKKMLEGEAEVIGPEAVAKREVLGSVHPYAFGGRFGGIVGVLEHFFKENYAGEGRG